ncbi:MAG: hypothetical protein ACP5GY_07510 [Vulcanisaeta sp.]
MVLVKLWRDNNDYYVSIEDKVIKVSGLRPIDYLLIAIAYGLGVRYLDKYGVRDFTIECEMRNDALNCRSACSGLEDKCFVYKLVKGGNFSLTCLSQP